MAKDMYMNIEGIKGEAIGIPGTIDVQDWRWGMANTASPEVGPGRGTGQSSWDALTFIHFVDKAFPMLMQYCMTGEHVNKAKLTLRKAAGSKGGQMEYLTIDMTQVFIAKVSPQTFKDDERVSEEVGLRFGKVEVNYTPQKPDGTPDSKATGTYDITTKKK